MTCYRQPILLRLGTRRRITLPNDPCVRHGLLPGMLLEMVDTTRGILIRPVPNKGVLSLEERIARTNVKALRSAGQRLRDEPSKGREFL